MDRLRRILPLIVLSGAFAVWLQFSVVLTGAVPAGALTAALAAGALVMALLAAPRPVAAVRGLSSVPAFTAAVGGLLAVAGAPACVAAMRLTDAPAGSSVVFWVSGGWAAIAACGAAVLSLREHKALSAGWSLAGGMLALAGVAGVVADWERPSSFSPLVRFPSQEIGMLLGGVLLLAGGLLMVRAARSASLDGVLIVAAAAASAACLVWWGVSGFADGWTAMAKEPLLAGVAAVAWGLVCSSWPRVLTRWGPAPGAAALSAAPVLLSLLILLEQVVGVAGPQPLIVPGVIAGSLLVVAAIVALAHAGGAERARRSAFAATSLVPGVLAAMGLALPAVLVKVDVVVKGGAFAGSWTMNGAESVAAWAAVALAVLVMVAIADARPVWPVVAALAASVAWPWLVDVPTHVWSSSLAPEIQQYYGTEYGTIAFTGRPNVATVAAVILGAFLMLAVMVTRRAGERRGASSTEDGGS